MKTKVLSAAALCAVAGQAMAQPTIDGSLDASFYGSAPLWVQNQPTSRGDNQTLSCDPCAVGSPLTVLTGSEIKIPLAALGNPTVSNIKITAMVTSGSWDFVSNQVAGTATVSLPCPSDNLGDPRNLNFATIANNQFFTNVFSTPAAAPALNGSLAGKQLFYGNRKFVQNNRTGFGDATGGFIGNCPGGSEINAIYAIATATDLHILVTGNLETNGNQLLVFVDSLPGVGQNEMRNDNPDISLNRLNRLGPDPLTPGSTGLRFDTGFDADYVLALNNSFDTGTTTYTLFADFARLSNVASVGDPGVGYFLGSTNTAGGDGTLTGGTAPVGSPEAGIQVSQNNSNIAGVAGFCPPSGGNPDVANGSEIAGLYGRIGANNKLYLLVTGNLANNFDKLQLFIDAVPGGQNTILPNNADIDFGALQRMGPGVEGTGLTFDTGFEPDYWINYGNGNGASSATIQVFSNSTMLRSNGVVTNGNGAPLDYGAFDGGGKASLPGGVISYDGPQLDPQTGFVAQIITNFAPRTASRSLLVNPTSPVGVANLARLGSNMGNLAGVGAIPTGTAAGAAAVTTGIELEIDLTELTDCDQPANPACSSISQVRVAGFVSYGASGAATISNQVIGGLPNSPALSYAEELGEVRAVNFTNVAGNQFVVVTRNASGGSGTCYANCDGSTNPPVLNALDFACFLNRYRAGEEYANCDASTNPPVLNALDFSCFLGRYRAPESGTNCTP